MSEVASRPSLLRHVYTHNPFYAISAVLMLFAVRSAYGTLEIGAINTWAMMGVLAAYTTVLGVIGVFIVRWGRVWEDARSILLLLVLLFLAVSISADDLFATSESKAHGTALMVCGLLFSAVVSEAVLWGTGIRFGAWLRIPYHLLLALFYLAPWWCTPELHPRPSAEQSWTLLAFPTVAAGLFLLLWPAVRRGPAYVANNGTPWRWPWFPWTVFGVFAAAVSLRSYVLSMTYGLTGPIWRKTSSGRAIEFDTIWGPYFLIPLAAALLILLLEAALSQGNRKLADGVLKWAPATLLLAFPLPLANGPVFRGFRETVTETLGAPPWLTVCLLVAFYAWAVLRRAPRAEAGLLGSVALLAVVGPKTVGLDSLTEPRVWPLAFVGTWLLVLGASRRSSRMCAVSLVPLTLALSSVVPETSFPAFRFTVGYHVAWLGVVAIGLVFRDDFARRLRVVGASLAVVTAFVLLVSPRLDAVPLAWRVGYLAVLTAFCLIAGRFWNSRPYWLAFAATISLACWEGIAVGVREAFRTWGRWPVTAFGWSVGTLLIAFLISAHKANWLPARTALRWSGGRGEESATVGDADPR